MKITKKLLSLLLALALVLGCVSSAGVFAETKTEKASLSFITLSDVHLFPDRMTGSRSEEWLKFCRLQGKSFNESEAILINALDNIAARAEDTDLKYILIPGDLTKDSEYDAHTRLAEILGEYSDRYGFRFLVTTGNHDVNNYDACTFENDTKEPARAITAAEFPVVYADFGYNDAVDRFAYPENGENVQGGLSYIYDLGDDFRLISVDSSIYGFTDVPQKPPTNGTVTDELNDWIHYWADRSYDEGKTPIVMVHHSMALHMEVEASIAHAFPLDDYLDVAEKWASWGLHYVYTGHLHTTDTSSVVTDEGEVLYDIETDSLTGFPNQYRENTITTYTDGTSSLATDSVDFDSDVAFSFDGVTYDRGTYKNKSFNLCFGGGIAKDGRANLTDFLVGIVEGFLGDYAKVILDAGGIVPFLKDSFDIDVQKIIADFLAPYIGGGINGFFTAENIMWFINDLDQQICDYYLKDPDKLYTALSGVLEQLSSVEVADVPCTRFIDTLGFGDETRNGNLSDLVLTAMYYWFSGNEDAEDDAFFMNAIEKLESGETCETLFNVALSLIVNDLLQEEILSHLEIRLETLIADNSVTKNVKDQIRNIGKKLLRNDLSYKHLIDVFFALEILPYDNVMDALNGMLISEYVTSSQFEGTGTFMAYVLKDFALDSDPFYQGDYGVSYDSTPVVPEATVENYRLPADIAITVGDDSATEANVSFYTKSTLTGDIEIYEAESEPEFTGTPTENAPFGLEVETLPTVLSYPGIDVGVIGFFQYEFKVNRTLVKLSGLKPGTKYFFRVGNSEHGWWSKTCSFTTADGGSDVTFIHTADPQSQTVGQYTRSWAKVLGAAYELYPDTDFSLNTGDLVDHGDNSKQWSMMFDTAGDTLRNTFLMPASGNHEGKGTNSTVNYFALPNMPDQDTTSGAYYSFDWNNVHVAVLNTNDLGGDNALSAAQTEWLKRDMNASDAKWKFVSLHKAIYSNGSHYDDKDVCALRDQLSVLMPQLGVDLVFQGHDHVYLRTGVMDKNAVVPTERQYLSYNGGHYKAFMQPAGTIYAISGTAGVKTYLVKDASQTDKEFPRAEKLLAVDHPMFSAVEVKDGVLYFTAYTVMEDGSALPIDRIAIQKDLSQGEVDPDYEEAEEAAETESCISTIRSIFDWLLRILRILMGIFRVLFIGV